MEIVKLFLFVFIIFYVFEDITASHLYVGPTPCIDDNDCFHLENATCLDEICDCGGTKICMEAHRLGTKVTRVGMDCRYQDDCNIENSECSENKCHCVKGYTYNAFGNKCFKIAEGLQDVCEEDPQCSLTVSNSVCINNKCSCLANMHSYNGTCYKNLTLGDICQHRGECSNVPLALCTKFQCTCINKYVQVPTPEPGHDICLPIGEKINDTCIDDIQCTITLGIGSACIDGFCTCKEMYQLKNSINKCVRDMMLNDNCETHTDCRDPMETESRLECIMGVCKCRTFYKEVEGHCLNSGHQYQAVSTTLVFLFVIFLSINFL